MTEIIPINKLKMQLENSDDLHEIRSIGSKAEILRQLAQKANLGLVKQNQYAEIKIRAERRCGQLLKNFIRHGGDRRSKSRFDYQTLKKLEIKKGQSFRWQSIALIPNDVFENFIIDVKKKHIELTSAKLLRIAKDYRKELKTRKQEVGVTNHSLNDLEPTIINADFRDVSIKPDSIDIILTDPPYGRKYISLHEDLARFASKVLKKNGSLLMMSGLAYLPEILPFMVKHLNYQWALAYLTPGATHQMWQRKVMSGWKPVFWFLKGKYEGDWIKDTAISLGIDKRFHKWGQSESGIIELIDKFTKSNHVVLDPMCGGGTVGASAIKMGRKFIGIDIDRDAIEATKTRINKTFTMIECLEKEQVKKIS